MTTPLSPTDSTPPAWGARATVHVFGRTDIGRVREHNEDTFLVADLTTMNASLQPEVCTHVSGDRGTLFIVADGMGGAAAGEIASAMATDIILEELRRRWTTVDARDPMTFAATLRVATETANLRIHQFATEHPEHRGMGTTVTLAGLLGDVLYLTQVGDSRAYLVRDGEARQITKDQSLMQRLIEAGEITVEEAEHSDRRNIILQALGPDPRIAIDLTHQQIRRGDVLVLCTDGLSGHVRTEEIAEIATQEREMSAVCRRLIDRANETGGSDNITVIAARFEGESLLAPETGEEVGHRVYPLGEEITPSIPFPKFSGLRRTPAGGVEGPAGEPWPGEGATPLLVDESALAERRQRARPLIILLAVLAFIVGAWAAWHIIGIVRERAGTAEPTGPAESAPRDPAVTPPGASPASPPL